MSVGLLNKAENIMGIWRRAQIEGEITQHEDIEKLKTHIDARRDFENFGPLSVTGGMAGLPMWPARTICAVGNLAERGYEAECIKEQLEELALVAPSLRCKVHMGVEHEKSEVERTITLARGKVTVGAAEKNLLPEICEAQMHGNLFDALRRGNTRIWRPREG